MLKTNSAITVMQRGAVLPTETEDKVLYGKVTDINLSFELGGVNVMYSYYETIVHDEGTETEWAEERLYEYSSKFYTFAQIEALKAAIPAIPGGLTEEEEMTYKYKEGLRIEMASRFGIEADDLVDV